MQSKNIGFIYNFKKYIFLYIIIIILFLFGYKHFVPGILNWLFCINMRHW